MLCNDIIKHVQLYDRSPAAYKKYCLVSAQWRACAAANWPRANITLCNQLQTLILLYPRADWDWPTLTRHKLIDLEFITNNDFPFYPINIAKNPNLTWGQIDKVFSNERKVSARNIFIKYNMNMNSKTYMDIYDWIGYQSHEIMRLYFNTCNIAAIKTMPPIICDGYQGRLTRWLPRCGAFTWDIVLQYPKLDWDYIHIGNNPNISAEIICNNLDKFDIRQAIGRPDWKYEMTAHIFAKYVMYRNNEYMNKLCTHKAITWEIVRSNPHINWSYRGLSANPNFTFDFMMSNNYPWVWSWTSANPNITMDIILANPTIAWCRRMLAKNPNITWKIVRDNWRFGWNFRALSKYAFGGAGIVGKI